MWPLKTFLRFSLKRSHAEYVVIWLSRFWQSSHLSLGDLVTAGIECSVGSAMCCDGGKGVAGGGMGREVRSGAGLV